MVATVGWQDEASYSEAESFSTFFNGTAGLPLKYSFTFSMWDHSSRGEMEILSKDECLARYNAQLQSSALNVVVVTTQATGTYRTLPDMSKSLDVDDVNPFTSSDLTHGVGLSLSPFMGNAVPFLNASYHSIRNLVIKYERWIVLLLRTVFIVCGRF